MELSVLSVQFSVNLNCSKIILLIFLNDMFHYKKESTFKVISNIPQRLLECPLLEFSIISQAICLHS